MSFWTWLAPGSSVTGSAWVTGGGAELVVEAMVVAPAEGLVMEEPQAARRAPAASTSAIERWMRRVIIVGTMLATP